VELSPVLVIVAVVAVVVSTMLIRWSRRHEATAPADTLLTSAMSSTMAARAASREGQPLVDWLLERAFEQTGIKVADDRLARERIEQAAGKAMEELQTGGAATVNLPFLVADAQGPKHFAIEFTRNPNSTFEVQR
jgi:hypothetical protein